METINFRQATLSDLDDIWQIILFAKESRRLNGSNQWQDGYPKKETILDDIEKECGFVVLSSNKIVGYWAIIFDKEPAYEALKKGWLSDLPYVVVHRMAVAQEAKGKKIGEKMLQITEEKAIQKKVFSLRVDTNFDNQPMLHILKKLGYTYCGEVFFRGSPRKAFEKLLQEK